MKTVDVQLSAFLARVGPHIEKQGYCDISGEDDYVHRYFKGRSMAEVCEPLGLGWITFFDQDAVRVFPAEDRRMTVDEVGGMMERTMAATASFYQAHPGSEARLRFIPPQLGPDGSITAKLLAADQKWYATLQLRPPKWPSHITLPLGAEPFVSGPEPFVSGAEVLNLDYDNKEGSPRVAS